MDMTKIIEAVSNWDAEDKTKKVAFIIDEGKENVLQIVNEFYGIYDIAFINLNHNTEVTLSKK
jgi:hypothetical protein